MRLSSRLYWKPNSPLSSPHLASCGGCRCQKMTIFSGQIKIGRGAKKEVFWRTTSKGIGNVPMVLTDTEYFLLCVIIDNLSNEI